MLHTYHACYMNIWLIKKIVCIIYRVICFKELCNFSFIDILFYLVFTKIILLIQKIFINKKPTWWYIDILRVFYYCNRLFNNLSQSYIFHDHFSVLFYYLSAKFAKALGRSIAVPIFETFLAIRCEYPHTVHPLFQLHLTFAPDIKILCISAATVRQNSLDTILRRIFCRQNLLTRRRRSTFKSILSGYDFTATANSKFNEKNHAWPFDINIVFLKLLLKRCNCRIIRFLIQDLIVVRDIIFCATEK